MSDMLVVTWGRTRAAALQVGSGDAAQVSRCWTAEWPANTHPAQDADAAGKWLQSQWQSAGLTAAAVWVVMSRDDVVLRHLELPLAPDDELPDMVRFQVGGRSSVPIDQLAVDYLPLAPVAGREGRDVLAVTLSRTFIESTRKAIEATDRQLMGISFASHALGEWGEQIDRKRGHARTPHEVESTLVVACEGPRVDLSIVTGRELTFAHVARLNIEDGQNSTNAVLAEVSRTLVASQRMRPGLRVDHGWVVGASPELSQSLTERLECPVALIDVVAEHPRADKLAPLQAYPSTMAVLLGASMQATPITARVNLLKPRQTPPKRDPRRQQIAIAAAAALLVSFVFLGGRMSWLQSLDRQLSDLRIERSRLNDAVKKDEPILAAATVIQDWNQRNINLLDQLAQIEATMPGGYDRPYLSDYDFTVATGDALAHIDGSGAAKSRDDIETLQQELTDRRQFQVFPKEVTASRDAQYPYRYAIDVNLLKQKPEPPKPATAPAKPAK